MKISPARIAAFDILMRIEKDGAFSSTLLPQYEEELSPKDKGLCHELTLGVLRRKLYLDSIIDELSKGKRIDIEVRVSLRMGLFQLIDLDRIPAHAALNDSVELVARAKKRSAMGFVNAVLRAFQRVPIDPKFGDPVEQLSVSTSHPRWLVEGWIDQFGFEMTESLCRANNQQTAMGFRVIGDEIIPAIETLVRKGTVRNSQTVSGSYVVEEFDVDLRQAADAGQIYFQDEGSQLVAQSVIAEGGETVLDVCAAPGGKTAMIAAASRSHVVAGDIHPNRVRQLIETRRLQSAKFDITCYDARQTLPFYDRTFDVVFVDAPCSGTGTIRHNPEIRYSITESDINALSRKQLLILQNASELVRVGGKLVYSTCSLERDENEAVCEEFENASGAFVRSEPKIPKRFLTEDGFARTFPYRDDLDGFFIAVFERN